MAEVAERAGVSQQTVSRVMNGFSGVRDSTRSKVEEAIEELGYRRNLAARTLVTRRSGLIGVIAVGSFLYGPTRTLAAIERASRQHGYLTLLATIAESGADEFHAAVGEFLDRSVEALIIIASRETIVRYSGSLNANIPVVIVGPRPADLSDLHCLSVDQAKGATMAIEHLVELGHQDIALVTGPRQWVDAQQRIDGALTACEQRGIYPRIFSGDWSSAAGYRAGTWLAELPAATRPTAVFSANDAMAFGILRALAEHAITLSVVGFDDVPTAEYFIPPLTTVHQDFHQLGTRVLNAILAALTEKEPDFSCVEPVLKVRESSFPAG